MFVVHPGPLSCWGKKRQAALFFCPAHNFCGCFPQGGLSNNNREENLLWEGLPQYLPALNRLAPFSDFGGKSPTGPPKGASFGEVAKNQWPINREKIYKGKCPQGDNFGPPPFYMGGPPAQKMVDLYNIPK